MTGRRRTWLLVVVVLAVAGGLAAWRLTSSEPVRSAAPTTVVGASTLAERVAVLEATVADRPDDLDAWQQLAVAYTQLAANTGDPAPYALASAAVDRASQLAPDAAGTLIAAGNLELSLHHFPEALAIAERGRVLHPSSPDLLAVHVDALVEMGQYEDAAIAAQALLDLRPDLPALARASYLRELNGDLTGALLAMQEAETAGAGTPARQAEVAVLLGDLALDAGQLDVAREAYARATQRSPDLVAAQVGVARTLAASGDLTGGIDRLQELVATTPAPAALFVLLGLQQAVGDGQGVESTAELIRVTLLLQEQSDQVVDLEFALFEADHGDPAQAVRLAERTHGVRPDNVFVQDALAWALHRAGRSDEARTLSEQALRLGSRDPLLVWHAAEIAAATGDEARARTLLERVAADRPWIEPITRTDALRLADRLGVTLASADSERDE